MKKKPQNFVKIKKPLVPVVIPKNQYHCTLPFYVSNECQTHLYS